ncbi:MAG: hypothetical protein LUG99_04615 [Lachnospiraceae bacterium]|nr:hypothetical protein [Lachnospiraceae bacterium]
MSGEGTSDSAEESAASNSGSTETGSSGSGSTTGTTTATTTFDILSVSTVFLSYVGDQDAFYQAAFDYILNKGCSGSITGTMSSYEIDPENKTATIRIMLSTGGTITGTYDKAANTYSFSGL